MTDEADIVKQLREAEKIGLFQSKVQSKYEKLETVEDPSEDVPDKRVGFIEDDVGYEITDKKELINEENFKKLLDFISDGFYSFDKEWRYTLVNKAAAQLVKMPKEKLIGKKITDLFQDIENTDFFKTYQKVMKTGKQDVANNEFVNTNGDKLWYEIKVFPIPKGILCVASDITKHKSNEETLKDVEQKWNSLIENTNDFIIIADKKGRIQFINKTLPPSTIDQIIGKTLYDFASPEFHELIKQNIENVIQTRESAIYQTSLIHGDGILWFETTMIPMIKEGETVGVMSFNTNITDHKKVEVELRENEEKLRSLVETTSDWIWEVDKNGIYTYASPKVNDLLGFRPEDVIGKTPFDFIAKDEVERINSVFLDCINNNNPIIGLENTNIHKNGGRVILETSGVPFHDVNGKLLGYRGIDRDITQRKKTEEALSLKNIVFETSIAANSIADCNGIITHVNPAFLKQWGYKTKDEAIGVSVASFFKNPEDANPVLEALNKTGKWEGEFHAVRKDGLSFISRGHSTVIKNGKGEIIGYQSTNIDITIEKQALEKLKKGRDIIEEKYKILYETSRDAIMTLAPPDWKFTSGNNATIELFNAKDEEEFTSKGPGDVSPEIQPNGKSSFDEAKRIIGEAMENGSNFFEWTHKTIDGKEFPAIVLLTRVEIEEGKPFLQATVRDITKQKKDEEELKERLFELERWKKVTMGREIEMRGLKNRIKELECKK